jgi:hypothetical protein
MRAKPLATRRARGNTCLRVAGFPLLPQLAWKCYGFSPNQRTLQGSHESSLGSISRSGTRVMVSKSNFFIIFSLAGAGLVLLIILMTDAKAFKVRGGPSASWNREAIKATYLASQLKPTDKGHSTLTLSYDLENDTDSDYRLDDGHDVVIQSRLKSDGSLSQQEPLRLSYPVFLPARQHARLAIEMTQPFVWPPEEDPAYVAKLREFVKLRLANVGEFVLFDQARRAEIRLPGAWQQIQEAAGASY